MRRRWVLTVACGVALAAMGLLIDISRNAWAAPPACKNLARDTCAGWYPPAPCQGICTYDPVKGWQCPAQAGPQQYTSSNLTTVKRCVWATSGTMYCDFDFDVPCGSYLTCSCTPGGPFGMYLCTGTPT